MNILFLGAHHDDLEVSIGGSVARWTAEGHTVVSAILTDSTWIGPNGITHRKWEQVESYTQRAAEVLGYRPVNLRLTPCLGLTCTDEKVVEVLRLLDEHQIDTLVALSPTDAHPDHRAAAEIALNASRRIPRVLLTRVSWNRYPGGFHPNFYVDVTHHLKRKSEAMRCFEDEYARTGERWEQFSEATTTLYGLEAGCVRAEGFEVLKWLW